MSNKIQNQPSPISQGGINAQPVAEKGAAAKAPNILNGNPPITLNPPGNAAEVDAVFDKTILHPQDQGGVKAGQIVRESLFHDVQFDNEKPANEVIIHDESKKENDGSLAKAAQLLAKESLGNEVEFVEDNQSSEAIIRNDRENEKDESIAKSAQLLAKESLGNEVEFIDATQLNKAPVIDKKGGYLPGASAENIPANAEEIGAVARNVLPQAPQQSKGGGEVGGEGVLSQNEVSLDDQSFFSLIQNRESSIDNPFSGLSESQFTLANKNDLAEVDKSFEVASNVSIKNPQSLKFYNVSEKGSEELSEENRGKANFIGNSADKSCFIDESVMKIPGAKDHIQNLVKQYSFRRGFLLSSHRFASFRGQMIVAQDKAKSRSDRKQAVDSANQKIDNTKGQGTRKKKIDNKKIGKKPVFGGKDQLNKLKKLENEAANKKTESERRKKREEFEGDQKERTIKSKEDAKIIRKEEQTKIEQKLQQKVKQENTSQ